MYKNILIPVVIDHDEDIQKAFGAARLLADEGANFTVMHVMEAIPGYVRGQISAEILKDRRVALENALKDIAGGLKGAVAELASGHAGQSIVNFANDRGVDCIIICSHTPGFKDYIIGSTANRVVHHAQCSVHVIR